MTAHASAVRGRRCGSLGPGTASAVSGRTYLRTRFPAAKFVSPLRDQKQNRKDSRDFSRKTQTTGINRKGSGNEIVSIRSFDVGSQLTKSMLADIDIIPDIQMTGNEEKTDFFSLLTAKTNIWVEDIEAHEQELKKILL